MKTKKIAAIIALAVLIILGCFAASQLNIEQLIKSVSDLPYITKFIAIVLLIMLQIFLAFLPGEPFELAAGYMLGGWQGTIACMIGSLLGTLVVFILVKIFKRTLIDAFFDSKKIAEAEKVFHAKKGLLWVFLLFLIPGTPKDIMTYLVSLSNIRLVKWLTLTTIGRIPSIITSTFLSSSIKEGQLFVGGIIFVITLLLVGAGTYLYKKTIQE